MFTKLKQWFVRNFIGTRETRTAISDPKAAALKTYALMLRSEKAANQRAQSENGVVYSTKNGTDTQKALENSISDDIISNDNRAQLNSASSINWVYKSELFSTSENILFHQKISEINQGSQAFTRNSQGEYMLPINNKIVFTNGDYDSPYVNRVIEIMPASLENLENIKRMILDAEKGILDYSETRRIIEISFGSKSVQQYNSSNNNPIRWTNGRREGSNRRKIVQRYQRERDARRNAESGTSSQSVSYSAKESDTVKRIIDNFNYNDVTANNIYKAARTLKQNTASKANTDELAYAVATAIEYHSAKNNRCIELNRYSGLLILKRLI